VAAAGGLLVCAALVPLAPALGVLWGAFASVLALLLALDLFARPRRDALEVRRELRRAYHVGRRGSFDVVLRNRSPGALEVALKEVLPHALEGSGLDGQFILGPGEERRGEVTFVGLSRGEHPLLPLGVRFGRPLGLLAYQHARADGAAALVLPGRPPGETEWLLSHAAALEEVGQRRTRRRGAEQEFESLRDYVVGDEIRRIDWKASARRSRPLVRQYESERNAETILAIDCGRLMGSLIDGVPKLDLALTPVLDLAAVALRRGERVGLLGFDADARSFVPPRAGLAQLTPILEAAARLPRGTQPTSYLRAVHHLEAHHRKRCLLVVFSDFTDELSAADMYASLAALTRRHVVLFVAVGDPHLTAILDGPAEDERAHVQRAVAGQLLGERRRVLARMERLGIFTVDAEPARLTGPLLRTFLEVRLRGAV
jgi:uncharacterized protein (DUF58 family)